MSILTDDSLEFAKAHIIKFYDSDFFPRAFEFEAIWHSWDEVKRDLCSRNVKSLQVVTPRTMTSMKPKFGFRVVQQLDPLNTLIYTALVYLVANQIEAARAPKDSFIACSYRIDLGNGSLFSYGNGFAEFVSQSESLSKQYQYVLATDITDFYNQVYLHRLSNAIESADHNLKALAGDIEDFLSRLNQKASQGVPVGPAASIVLAEGVLIDIDSFLVSKGVFHTRYVDDFRIFSNSESKLFSILEELTLYMYENHRLTLSSEKTKLIGTREYADEILHNQYELERIELFEMLEMFNPYSGELEEVPVPIDDEETLANAQISILAAKVLERKALDLGLSRALIRKAKKFKIDGLAQILLEKIDFFAPVINDVCLYLNAVSSPDFIEKHQFLVVDLSRSALMERGLVRLWVEWYITSNKALLSNRDLAEFIRSSPNLASQACLAIALRDISWVRTHKSRLNHVGDWERRSIIRASQVLPSDEKKHWLKQVEREALSNLDKYVAKWIRETT
ncbi:reverse transcriptase [Formosimonas limnophila]|uniref:Reverse transcriptase n=1 Tax=Formosimonas limnophila TaxID=1384487 RepID=A0A8J3G0G5_9BURK|nr:RNA-directed DNA polymerase [Formosimonas limnophila]GHA73632.1 reverse transcriptase [Formosimonas limnophila]